MTTGTELAFNVLDEPWIPVRTHDGSVREVGLKEAFRHASGYSGLAETSPPNLIALYRLLFAVLHRALATQYGPWTSTDRARWFCSGQGPTGHSVAVIHVFQAACFSIAA